MGTDVEGIPAGSRTGTVPDEATVKYAMLSVYYHSVGDRFSISGAPSVFVPPETTPLPLADALAVVAADRGRLEQALWQIVRNTPIRQAGEKVSRYPAEVADYLDLDQQDELDAWRATYRQGASLVAACLRACHHDNQDLVRALLRAAADPKMLDNPGFGRVVRLLFDQHPDDFLAEQNRILSDDQAWARARAWIEDIEREVGLGIVAYVEQLAATAAYEHFTDRLRSTGRRARRAMTVYPVASPIQQSTAQLWTSATVTTLARGRFDELLQVTDPANWRDGSDVIETSRYVADPITLRPGEPTRGGRGSLSGLLYEVAAMSWGRDSTQQGVFENVLNVSRTLKETPGHRRRTIHINFSLCRSISSRVLWDSRTGGIMLNEGFMRVVPLGDRRWRVTSRKLLRFSDRTPYSGTNGWTDFGQLLNYLAPAALSWWVETETYSLGKRAADAEPTPT